MNFNKNKISRSMVYLKERTKTYREVTDKLTRESDVEINDNQKKIAFRLFTPRSDHPKPIIVKFFAH